jgi:hypothetical protein
MGISGGNRKIKSKELLDMKKGRNIQKGGQGQPSSSTNPADRTYITLPIGSSLARTDGQVLSAIRFCESTRKTTPYSTTSIASSGAVSTASSTAITSIWDTKLGKRHANTSTAFDMVALRDCIGERLYQAAYTVSKTADQRTPVDPSLPYPGFCTYAQDVRDTCPPGILPSNPSLTTTSGRSQRFAGGSRKKNSRPKAKRKTVKKSKY